MGWRKSLKVTNLFSCSNHMLLLLICVYMRVDKHYLVQSMEIGYAVFCSNQSKEKLGYSSLSYSVFCFKISRSHSWLVISYMARN